MKGIDAKPRLQLGLEAEAKPMLCSDTSSFAGLRPARFPFPAIRPGEGVSSLKPKLTRFKQGIVTVTEGLTPKRGETFWAMRYVDPDTGKEVQRRVAGIDREEARAMALHLTKRAFQGKGYLAGIEKAPTLEEGIMQAVRLSRARPYIKKDMLQRAKPFLAYMTEHYPAVRTWGDLKPGMVESYIRFCEDSGLAFDTIRMRVAPIKTAWRCMQEDWPDLVKAVPRLRLSTPPRREIECLEACELAALLDWLRVHATSLWPMACLQGLVGLRMMEVTALRIQDVDSKAGTVTICDTGFHKPKSRSSYRTLPICAEALESLRWAIQNQKVHLPTGELFLNQSGERWTTDGMTGRWRRTLDHVAASPKVVKRSDGKPLTLNKNGLGLTRLGTLPARKLRAAFATMAGRLGSQDRILKAYLGHTADDVLGNHYRRIGLDELRAVSDLMNGWRQLAQPSGIRKDSVNNPSDAVASH